MSHCSIRAKQRTIVLLLLLVVLLTGPVEPLPAGAAASSTPGVLLPRAGEGQEITWSGAAGDGAWSNPENWEGGRVPGPADTVRLVGPASDARVDAAFGGTVAGLFLEADYAGTLRLERVLQVQGDLELAGGTLQGGNAGLDVGGAVRVSGGLLVTPAGAPMNVVTLDITAPGVVRLGPDGKLNLSGSGQPLQGDGLLDTTTYRPNSVECTGKATADLTAAGPAAELRAALPEGFARIGALPLEAGEYDISSAVIDPAGGFAYFGAGTEPGIVVKVDLATFTRVGALTLNAGEDRLWCAVIDPAGGYAYFGTDTGPGIVVKVDLATFTRVGALPLNAGEDELASAVIDPAGGFAYFGTYTQPGIVVRVDLINFAYAGALTLNPGEDNLVSAVIDPAGGFAYFGTGTAPGIVVKVDLTTGARVGALPLNPGEDWLASAVIDPAGGFAYFGTATAPGIVVQVNLATFTRVGALPLNPGEDFLESAVIDPAGGFAYFGTATQPGIVVKVDLTTFAYAGALTLNPGEDDLWSAVIDPAGGYAYFDPGIGTGIVVKVDLTTFTRVGALMLKPGEEQLHSAVVDPAGGFAYFGTVTQPGVVVKVDLATFTRVGVLTLNPGEDELNSAVIDPAGGFAYFGAWTDPGRVVKVDLATFTRAGALTLNAGEKYLASAVIDPAGGFAYFGTNTIPGIVVQVNLATFTRAGALTLNAGEYFLGSAVIDPAAGYAYFGTGTAPGVVVKVDLAPFTRVGALTLNPGEDYLPSAVIDPAAGYAYFGANTAPGVVVKVDLTTFTRVGALTLQTGENYLPSAVIDPAVGYAYFGTATNPGRVVQVDLATFTRTDALTLNAGESYLASAVIDPAAGFAYFGTNTIPGIVVKIDVGFRADLSCAKSDSPDPVAAGTPLTYTLAVANAGPDDAAMLRVTDILPAGVTFLDASGSGWTCGPAGGQVICTRASLPVGAAPDITIHVTAPPAAGTIINNAVVTSGGLDPNPANNTATETTTVQVAVAGLVAANDSPTALGQPTHLTATVTAGDQVAYAWDLGDGTTASGALVAHTYPAVGTYTALVTASNTVSLLTSTTVVTVVEGCTPPHGAGFDWTPITPTVGEEVAFNGTASGTEPLTYTWDLGDGNLGSGPNPAHTYETAGDYTVVMTVTNDCGEEIVTHAVTVVEGCTPPHSAGFDWTPITPTVGEEVAFNGTAGGAEPLTYTWDLGDGNLGSGPNPAHTYETAGDYTVVMTVTNDCGEEVVSHIVTISEEPICVEVETVELSLLTSGTIYTDTLAEFGADIGPDDFDAPYAYTIDYGDGHTDTGTSSADPHLFGHTYTATGSYVVEVAVWNCAMIQPITDTVGVTVYEPGVCVELESIEILGETGGYPGVYTFTTAYLPPDASLPIDYLWDNGDGTAASTRELTVGVYAPMVTATNCSETLVTATHVITISEEPICAEIETVELTLLTTGTIYTDTLLEFSADIGPDGFDAPYTYTIDYGDGTLLLPNTSSADPHLFHYTYAHTGSYTVVFAAWNCAMTEPVSDAVQVVVSEPATEGYAIYLPLLLKN